MTIRTCALASTAALMMLAAPALAVPSASAEPDTRASMANPDGAAPETLSSIQRPPSKIATANVLDASGQTIGAVQRVEVTPDGTPTRVAIALIGRDEKMVVLDADAVKYDPVKNEILAQQSGAEIRSKPKAG
jgi:hypothetical protein